MPDTKKQFFRNTVTGWLTQLSGAAVGFILLPLNIHYLGKDAYGISALAVSVLALLYMLDLGMAPALLRFFSQALAKKEVDHLKTLVSTSTVLLGGLGLLGFTVIILLSPVFIKFYHVAPSMTSETYYLLLSMGISFFLSFVSIVYNGLLLANNRYDTVNYIAIASQLLRLGLLLLFYKIFTPSLALLGFATVIGSLCNLIVLVVISYNQIGISSLFSFESVNKKSLSPLFSFSSLVLINSLFFSASTQVPVMIIGKTLGIDMVTAFIPAVTVSMYLASILSQISNPLVPLASRDLYQNEGNNIGRWATLLGQLVACIGCSVLLVLIMFGREILIVWLGQDMAWTSLHVIILASGVVFGSIQAVNYSLALGTSNIAPIAYSSVWMAIVSSGAIFLGTIYFKWHLLEVATCMTVVRFIRNGYYLPKVFSYKFKYNYPSYFVKVYIKPAIGLIPLIIVSILLQSFRIPSSTMIILSGCIITTISYLSICWCFVIEDESKYEIKIYIMKHFKTKK